MKFQILTLALPFLALPLAALAADLPVPAAAPTATPPAPEKIALWPDQAPLGDGRFEKANPNPTLTLYRPAKPSGAAAIICPGGGYAGLVMGAEGSGIAQWLGAHGITGIVLQYRLPQGREMVPLLDAQRAIRTARSKAKEWGFEAGRLGIVGFSAGGHLAATTATHFDAGNAAATDPVERASCRPDFAILVYPVITMIGEKANAGCRQNLMGPNPTPETMLLFSNEKQVTVQTSPTFLAHAVNDRMVAVDHSRMFYEALQAHKVPAQLLELPSGDHGLNGYKGPMWDAWQNDSLKWLASLKIIAEADALPNATQSVK